MCLIRVKQRLTCASWATDITRHIYARLRSALYAHAGAPSTLQTAFGSISKGELSIAARLAEQAYMQDSCRPLPGCREDSKYVRITASESRATTYFAFPGSHNAGDWQVNALHSMKPLSAWADRLPDLAKLPEPAHQVGCSTSMTCH